MKCEDCGYDKVWIGSMQDGRLACEHCIDTDLLLNGCDSKVVEGLFSETFRALEAAAGITVTDRPSCPRCDELCHCTGRCIC